MEGRRPRMLYEVEVDQGARRHRGANCTENRHWPWGKGLLNLPQEEAEKPTTYPRRSVRGNVGSGWPRGLYYLGELPVSILMKYTNKEFYATFHT